MLGLRRTSFPPRYTLLQPGKRLALLPLSRKISAIFTDFTMAAGKMTADSGAFPTNKGHGDRLRRLDLPTRDLADFTGETIERGQPHLPLSGSPAARKIVRNSRETRNAARELA